jgi:hypothetical protein
MTCESMKHHNADNFDTWIFLEAVLFSSYKILSCLTLPCIGKLFSIIYREGIWSNLRIKLIAAQEIFRHKFNADIQIDFPPRLEWFTFRVHKAKSDRSIRSIWLLKACHCTLCNWQMESPICMIKSFAAFMRTVLQTKK